MGQFDAMADFYDDLWGTQVDEDAEVAFIAAHAGDGEVLEVGVGTGRVAIPLARRGHRVLGLDNSKPMLDRLTEKLGTGPAPVGKVRTLLGGMGLAEVNGPFSLVYSVYHTLFYAGSRDEQRSFFAAAARVLEPGGRLIVEAYNPSRKRLARWNAEVHVTGFDSAGVRLELIDHDVHGQTVHTGQLVLTDGVARWAYHDDRYLWPEQMDEMAAAAGLILRDRWSGWGEGAFDVETSGRSVSLWVTPGNPR